MNEHRPQFGRHVPRVRLKGTRRLILSNSISDFSCPVLIIDANCTTTHSSFYFGTGDTPLFGLMTPSMLEMQNCVERDDTRYNGIGHLVQCVSSNLFIGIDLKTALRGFVGPCSHHLLVLVQPASLGGSLYGEVQVNKIEQVWGVVT